MRALIMYASPPWAIQRCVQSRNTAESFDKSGNSVIRYADKIAVAHTLGMVWSLVWSLHTATRVRIVISNHHYIMRLLVDTIMIV